jgi:hypothetical protein
MPRLVETILPPNIQLLTRPRKYVKIEIRKPSIPRHERNLFGRRRDRLRNHIVSYGKILYAEHHSKRTYTKRKYLHDEPSE